MKRKNSNINEHEMLAYFTARIVAGIGIGIGLVMLSVALASITIFGIAKITFLLTVHFMPYEAAVMTSFLGVLSAILFIALLMTPKNLSILRHRWERYKDTRTRGDDV